MNNKSNQPDRNFAFDKSEQELDLFDYLIIIIKQWKLILILFVVTVTATAIISLNLTPRYMAQTSILPISSETSTLSIVTSSGLPLLGENKANNQKILAILNSRTIRENVINTLKWHISHHCTLFPCCDD